MITSISENLDVSKMLFKSHYFYQYAVITEIKVAEKTLVLSIKEIEMAFNKGHLHILMVKIDYGL